MNLSSEYTPSEKSEDWLSINFGHEVDEEVVKSLEELRKQESRTYERLYTPPEVDSAEDFNYNADGDQQS